MELGDFIVVQMEIRWFRERVVVVIVGSQGGSLRDGFRSKDRLENLLVMGDFFVKRGCFLVCVVFFCVFNVFYVQVLCQVQEGERQVCIFWSVRLVLGLKIIMLRRVKGFWQSGGFRFEGWGFGGFFSVGIIRVEFEGWEIFGWEVGEGFQGGVSQRVSIQVNGRFFFKGFQRYYFMSIVKQGWEQGGRIIVSEVQRIYYLMEYVFFFVVYQEGANIRFREVVVVFKVTQLRSGGVRQGFRVLVFLFQVLFQVYSFRLCRIREGGRLCFYFRQEEFEVQRGDAQI